MSASPPATWSRSRRPARGWPSSSRSRWRSSTARGELVEGPLEPTSELGLHLGLYERFDAGAVVHTHAPMATAIACVVDELPCVHYSMLLLGGTVRVAPYETFGTPELAEAVAEALEGRTAALMANHGAVVYGVDLEAAIEASAAARVGVHGLLARARARRARGRWTRSQRAAVVEAALERGYGAPRPAGEDG